MTKSQITTIILQDDAGDLSNVNTGADADIWEKIRNEKKLKTFRELSIETGICVNTLKFHVYRVRIKGPRRDHESSQGRPDYAAIIGALIQMLAEKKGVTEGCYRRFLKTRRGEQEFREACVRYNIPVFTCRYQAKKENGC